MNGIFRQSLRFALVGIVNTLVGLAVIFGLMFFFGIGPGVANALGYAIGLLISFVLNRLWTFESGRSVKDVLPKYLAVAFLSYLLNLGIVLSASSGLGINPYVSQVMGIVSYTIFMFCGCRWFVFASHRGV